MKYINGFLCISQPKLEGVGISSRTIESWTNIKVKDPDCKTKSFFPYEKLKDAHKDLIILKYGNPYEYLSNSELKEYLKTNYEARTYFNNYKLSEDRFLPKDYVAKYTKAAEWLDLIRLFTEKGSKPLLNKIGLNREQFWNTVTTLLEAEKIDLPYSYFALNKKRKQYVEEGFKSLISKKFLNQNTRKVLQGESLTVLLQMLSHQHKFDDNYIALNYNKWAISKGFKTITFGAVADYRIDYAIDIKLQREGAGAYHNEFGKNMPRKRPSSPLFLINGDDNTLDLYFIDGKNKYHRFVMYMVIDTYNDYPLGWAIGDNISKDLVRRAFVNAKNHIKGLTDSDNHYMWQQIQTDHWALDGDLRDFFENQAHFTPPALKNARGKYIEQSFGHIWHEQLKRFSNYSGHNIVSKQKMNPDMMSVKNHPDANMAVTQISLFVEALRNYRQTEELPTRKEQWLEGFAKCPTHKKRMISDEELILFLGKKHEHKNTLTSKLLTPTLLGQKIIYDIPESHYYDHVGETINVHYYESDLTKVLACNDDMSVRILCPLYDKLPSCIADMEPGDALRIKSKQQEQKRISQNMLDRKHEREAMMQRMKIDAESLLQAGVMVKELYQPAVQIAQVASIDPYSILDTNEVFETVE